MNNLQEFKDDITRFLDEVRSFARERLNCECEEHVFEQVRFLRGEASPGKTNLAIVIGERLLILFADYADLDPFDFEMPRLILSGVTYRDSIGLNRLRLVMSGDVTDEHRSLIGKEITRYDEKVYVHFLP